MLLQLRSLEAGETSAREVRDLLGGPDWAVTTRDGGKYGGQALRDWGAERMWIWKVGACEPAYVTFDAADLVHTVHTGSLHPARRATACAADWAKAFTPEAAYLCSARADADEVCR
jgi:hypothetical protein